jgi:MFS family permease
MIIAGLVGSMGLNSPLAFGPDFGRAVGLDAKTSANTLAVINAVGSPSRIILGFLGDAYGRQNMQIVAGIVSTMSVFALWLVAAKESIKALWWIFSVVYGGLGGAWGLFLSPILIDVFGSDVFFGAIATINLARGVGSLAGPPLGAALLGTPTKGADTAEKFVSLAVFTGVLMFVATTCAVVVRMLHGRRNGWSWRA